MLITYFKNPATLARCRSGLAHPYLEDFVVWLEQQGYRRRTICYHVFEVVHFANWAEAEGLARRDLNRDALDRLGRQMTERKASRHPSLDRRYVFIRCDGQVEKTRFGRKRTLSGPAMSCAWVRSGRGFRRRKTGTGRISAYAFPW